MTAGTSRQPIPVQRICVEKVIIIALLAFVFSAVSQVFWFVGADAQEPSAKARGQADRLLGAPSKPDACLANLPEPTPKAPAHRVVQLVNCSNQTLLGAANAAHQVDKPPTAVLPPMC